VLTFVDDPLEGFPAGREVPFFAAGLPAEDGLRWAMVMPSGDRMGRSGDRMGDVSSTRVYAARA
jgi:hypothetical protein